MSTPFNPLPPEQPQLSQEIVSPQAAETVFADAVVAGRVAVGVENPAWTLLDVFVLVIVFFATMLIMVPIAQVIVGATHLFGYSLNIFHDHKEMDRFAHDLRILLSVQLVSYLILLFLMVRLVRARARVEQGFFYNLSWRWPHTIWPGFLLAGTVLAIAVLIVSSLLPSPPSLPIDRFFQTQLYAYLMAGFGILVAPFIEELFFRGFLYPALERPLGMMWAVILTSLAFMLVHGSQLSFAWAPLLMLLLVGVVLGLVRARTRALAASVLIHVGYNTTIFVISFISTGGFHHLEKM